jgi:hypothetical protein
VCYSDGFHILDYFRKCVWKINDCGYISENSTRNGSIPITTEQLEKGRLKMSGMTRSNALPTLFY